MCFRRGIKPVSPVLGRAGMMLKGCVSNDVFDLSIIVLNVGCLFCFRVRFVFVCVFVSVMYVGSLGRVDAFA